MTVKNIVENNIFKVSNYLNPQNSNSLAKSAVDQHLLLSTSTLGSELKGVAGGFEALTTSVDDVVASIPESKPQNVTNTLVISQMTEKVPEVSSKLKPAVGSDASDLEQITGSTSAASSAMLNVVVAHSRPDAIAAAVKATVPDATAPQLQNIAANTIDFTKGIGTNDFQSAVDFDLNLDGLTSSLNQAIGFITNATQVVDNVTTQLVSSINDGLSKALANVSGGFNSLIENAVELGLSPANSIIQKLATINGVKQTVPQSDVKTIISFAANSDYEQAAKVMGKYSDTPNDQIVSSLRQIDNRLSTVSKNATPGVPINAKDLEGVKNNWDDPATTKFSFELIDSKEELTADLRAAKREITEVVIHHTYTGTNVAIAAEDVDMITKRDYGLNIPYHYIFTRDGGIQRGRPISTEMDQQLPNNHQKRSIHICLVGGLSSPEGGYNTTDYKKLLSKKSFTRDQWSSLDTFLSTVFAVYPYIQVLGHNSIDPENPDPNFDPIEYVQTKFGKPSAFDDPKTQPPFTRTELIKRFM